MKLPFCPFCTYAGGNDLSYLNHIIIAHYNASYRCGKCLKQAFISSLALHTHKKACLRLTSRKAAGVLDGKPSSGRGNSSHGILTRPPPKRMARWLPPAPRAQVPLQPLSLHHATADGGPPTITSPTRRTRARSERRQKTRAQPREAPDTRHTMMGATTKQACHQHLQAHTSFQ